MPQMRLRVVWGLLVTMAIFYQRIEQGGFAHVGAADNGDDS